VQSVRTRAHAPAWPSALASLQCQSVTVCTVLRCGVCVCGWLSGADASCVFGGSVGDTRPDTGLRSGESERGSGTEVHAPPQDRTTREVSQRGVPIMVTNRNFLGSNSNDGTTCSFVTVLNVTVTVLGFRSILDMRWK
jgi:hypothetical protein